METYGRNHLHEGRIRLTPAVCVTGNVNKSCFDKGLEMSFLLILNAIFVVLSWRWAMEAFSRGQTGAGYLQLAISALNFAVILSVVL